jgi:hypothetical protein
MFLDNLVSIIIFVALVLISMSLRIVKKYDLGVIFFLGKPGRSGTCFSCPTFQRTNSSKVSDNSIDIIYLDAGMLGNA